MGTSNGTTAQWLLYDLLGSVVASEGMANTSIVDALRYDAYGQTLGEYQTTGTDLAVRFRGLIDLAPTADPDVAGNGSDPLYQMGARAYAPHLGTFTKLDTYAGTAQEPISLNRYLYAHANPATLIDPSGHCVVGRVCADGGGSGTTREEKEENPEKFAPKYIAPPTSSTGGGDAGGAESDPDAYLVPLPRQPTEPAVIDFMSIGQLQAYLLTRHEDCVGQPPNIPGCEDYFYAKCSLGNATGGSNDCYQYASPPDPATELTIDVIAAAAAVASGLALPAIKEFLRSPDKAAAVANIIENARRGRSFERDVLTLLRELKNTEVVAGLDRTGQLRNVIPDAIGRGLIEIKAVQTLTDARGQLSAMGEIAHRAGVQFNIFVGANFNGTISQTVQDAVRQSGGAVYQVDLVAGTLKLVFR